MIYDDQTFSGIDFSTKGIDGIEYNGCRFENCNFTNLQLRGVEFIDCEMVQCNLSQVKLPKAGLKNVSFTGCKLLGVDFSLASDFLFAATFDECNLDYAIFIKKSMKGFLFRKSSLKAAIFENCTLSNAIFDNCDLTGTTFVQNNLQQADFRTASGYIIDINQNKIKGGKFSYPGIIGLLDSYQIDIE